MHYRLPRLVVLLWLIELITCTFQSQFGRSFNYSCSSPYQTISHIESVHDNSIEDRKYKIDCRDVSNTDGSQSVDCYWTDIANMFDQQMTSMCKSNHYVNGVYPRYDPSRNDRTWKIHCCAIQGVSLTNCELSDWTNTLDHTQTYDVPNGMVLKDILSSFTDYAKDRRFRFVSCSTTTKSVVNMHTGIDGGNSWLNTLDQPLDFQCSDPHHGIAKFESKHDNKAEDRQFKLGCREVAPMVGSRKTSCTQGGAANEYHNDFYFMCPGNGYIRGMHSEHNNYKEDRIWKFQCCETEGISMGNCEMTVWKNFYDWYLKFPLPDGTVMRGVISRFDGYYNDREYRFQICHAIDYGNDPGTHELVG